MRQPFQCLGTCSPTGTSDSQLLIAAAGSHIYTYRLKNGELLATWPPSQTGGSGSRENTRKAQQAVDEGREAFPGSVNLGTDDEPQSKRRKLSASGETSDSTSTEIVVEKSINADASSIVSKFPVIKLATTSDGKHVIAVTGDDKCIRVFSVLPDGALRQLSERYVDF